MRISSVSLYSNKMEGAEELLTFSLIQSDPTALYFVRDMTGLDAEELIPKFYGFSLYSKDKYYDFVMKPRTIVLRLVMNPRFNLDESYSDIRDNLYRAISTVRNGSVVLHFNYMGTTVARIYGFITKFEVPYMTPLPEVQLSLRCDDPIFRAINPVVYDSVDLEGVNPLFINDDLSTAPHGFSFQVTFDVDTPSFNIQDAQHNPEWTFRINPTDGFKVGDILNFSSEYSNKQLYISRGASTIYIMDRIQPNSFWPLIFPGPNSFYFMDVDNINWNSLRYYAAYWGV